MIYLIHRGIRVKSALNILVNEVKYLGMYNDCLCSGCKDKTNVKDNEGTCFADDNDEVEVNDNVNDYVNRGRDEILGSQTCLADIKDNDKVDNVNVFVNDNFK